MQMYIKLRLLTSGMHRFQVKLNLKSREHFFPKISFLVFVKFMRRLSRGEKNARKI